MSSTRNSLPSFGSTLPSARNTTVARDLSLPFRRDVNAPWQAPSTPLSFKVLSSHLSFPLAYHFSRQNPQNSRAQATFRHANEASNFSDVDVETQSFSTVDEIPVHQFYGQKFTVCMFTFFPWLRRLTSFSIAGCFLAAAVGHQGLWCQDHSTLKSAMVDLRKETIPVIETRVFFLAVVAIHIVMLSDKQVLDYI